MTTQTIVKRTAQSERKLVNETVPAAEVWDLPVAQNRQDVARSVRRVSRINRNSDRQSGRALQQYEEREDAFEPRHEKRTDALMGAVLGLALILGSAAGGVFSHGASPSSASTTVETVSANAR